MRFLPLSLPAILGYAVSALVVAAPGTSIEGTRPEADNGQQVVFASPLESLSADLPNVLHAWNSNAPQAQCVAAKGVQVAAAPVMSVVQNGLLTQLSILVFQIVTGTLAQFRPRFCDTSEHELVALALLSLTTR
jgi:hypothetical protein